MRIRDEQMAAFSRAAESDYEERVTVHLERQFQDARAVPHDELREGVREQIARARGHGLGTERDVATYVVAAWVLGTDFDTRYPDVRANLSSPHVPPSEKAAFVRRRTEELVADLEGRGAR